MAASAPPACSTSRKEVSAFMRRAGIILAMLIALTSLNTGTGGAAGSTSAPQFVPDQLLINLKSGTDLSLILQMVGGGLSQYLDGLGTYVVRVPPGTVESAIAILRTYPQVRFVEPNYYVRYFLDPDDPYDNSTCYPTSDGQCTMQWAWAKVGAYQAWDLTTGSEAVKVAVVDTGIDIGNPDYIIPDPTGHEDLVTCRSIVTQNFVTTESNNDENGHGTHVAGTIGACTNNATGIAGANWAVQLLSAKVLDFSGSGTYSALAAGIRWAADAGAKVINLSVGGSQPSKTLEQAINYAWNKGAVLVCAAGNTGTTTKSYPAAYGACIAVAATDEIDALASFSSYGADWVDVAAPGVRILSTMQDDYNTCFLCSWYGISPGYDAMSGTSMAAPHVSGLAALIWARGKCTSNTCVRGAIESTADKIAGSGVFWKYGRVNYANAVK
ncbi:MAG: peptidase S8 [Bacillati bacterium ANGP1]|uniref:Peptidase S8 n=2 Tax=Candidatus Segetimicrobium genomatis TaxID=2569760 RepID=A0A537LP61_9BACT|nr:MAG: peptidase S8 [Terrabacteria group bacterium ANGP1]